MTSRRLDLIVAALETRGCRPRNGYAKCPAHDGHHIDSLTYKQGDNGGVVVQCHSKGCSVQRITAALGMTVSDLMPERASGNVGRPIEVASYPYHDRDGALLFEVVRREPKAFRQRRPDGSGNYILGLSAGEYERQPGNSNWYRVKEKARSGAELRTFPECPRVLFRLPETLAAVAAGRTVYIVEGEQDVETLLAWGLNATTNPGGARRWRPEFSEVLRGARVVIMPDGDDKGRLHAAAVAAALHGLAAEVWVVEVPAGKDVTEWRDQHGGTREELERLVTAVPTRAPGECDVTQPEAHANSLRVVTMEQFLALNLPSRPCLLNPWLRERDLVLLYGWRGVGKTLAVLQVAWAVSTGGTAFGWLAERPAGVL